MIDLKALKVTLEQLESERGIPKEKIIGAIEDALAAAYKKDYGKRGQIVRASFDTNTGDTEFVQVKKVVDESMVRMEEEDEDKEGAPEKKEAAEKPAEEEAEAGSVEGEEEKKPRFNPEQHILLEDARKIKKDVQLEDELIFPLEARGEYGRIAAQTAKQVIIQRIREAERESVTKEYESRQGEVVTAVVRHIERGNVYADVSRANGVILRDEQIPGEYYKAGDRFKAYLYAIEERPREVVLLLSRSHPKFLTKLLEIEVPEIANGVVEIKSVAREAGSRAKIAVFSHDEHIDPVGSCVGQRGVRVSTVTSELGGERIDIIEWIDDPAQFIAQSLSPATIENVTLDEAEGRAIVEVQPDQYSLAIGKGGQNARLAARLTGYKIDIREPAGKNEMSAEEAETADEAQQENEKDAEESSNTIQEEKTE